MITFTTPPASAGAGSWEELADKPATATQQEMEAGLESAVRIVSPLPLRQTIDVRLAEGIDIDGGQL
jgi:hypothetical protein